MRALSADAGFTILEMLVGLAILSGLVAMIGASTVHRRPSEALTIGSINAFVTKVRMEAIISGKAQLIHVDPRGMRAGGAALDWSDSTPPIDRNGQRLDGPFNLVVYSDGSISGSDLFVQLNVTRARVSAPWRGDSAVVLQ
jgi:prepilin-type N-terminal cleavage/methylation domain-containing protein